MRLRLLGPMGFFHGRKRENPSLECGDEVATLLVKRESESVPFAHMLERGGAAISQKGRERGENLGHNKKKGKNMGQKVLGEVKNRKKRVFMVRYGPRLLFLSKK